MPSSKKYEPGSISLAMRSRAVSRPFLCCDSTAFAPPPWRICSSSFLIFVSKSMMRRVFFSNSGDFRFALVLRTESDTRSPHSREIFEKTFWQRQWREPSLTVYEFRHHCATAVAAMVIPFRIGTKPACKDSVRVHCPPSQAGTVLANVADGHER